jgi:uncharacterized membrane protein HdeD (DUF308 family)
VEREDTGRLVLDRRQSVERLESYLMREAHMPEGEAKTRASELVGLLAAAPLPLLGFAGTVTQHWWLFLLRGILAVLFGVLLLVQPIAALTALVLVFGVWAFIDGVAALALSIGDRRSWGMALAGLVGIAVGLLTFFKPETAAVALYALVAAWAVARGILEIGVAIELRKVIRNEVWLILGGLASIAFGVLMILLPVAGVLAIAWLIGVYALVFGVLMFGLAFRLRELRPAKVTREAAPPPPFGAHAQPT